MDQKYGEFVGVDQLHYALITTDDETTYVAATPVELAPVASIAGEPEISQKTTYYNNVAMNCYITEGKTELKVVVSGVPASVMAVVLGKYFDATTGRIFDTGEANPPDVALGFVMNRGSAGDKRYQWFLNGKLSGGAEEASSKNNDVDEKTYTLTYTAVTTTHKWAVDGKQKSIKRIVGDTTDENFDETGWFTAVQTPPTV